MDAPLPPLADAITVAVVRAKLKAIVEEVVEVMARTAFSPLLNQSRDFSTAIVDAEGRLLAQAERVPIHMGALPFAVAAVRERFGDAVADGDIFLLNDPYHGGSHLPDFTLCLPILADGAVRFWIVNRAHQGDIGGISPGGYSPQATEIWHEGLRLPPVRFVTAGRLEEGLFDVICLNSRMPEDTRGDVMAQLASVRAGAARLQALCARYGIPRVEACCDAILDAGERAMRAQLRAWADGVYEGESCLDPTTPDGVAARIHARVTIRGDAAEVDLRGSSDQVPSFLNSSRPNSLAAVNVAFAYLGDGGEAQNGGSGRPLTVLTRPGSILDPLAPAPVTACTTLTAGVVVEAVMKAMEQAAPAQVVGGFARRFRLAIAGEDRNGRRFLWHHFSNRGGAGGHAGGDGWSNLGVVHSPGGTPSPSIERTEAVFPLTVEAYHLRPGSGGKGRYRGGLGGVYVLRWEGAGPGRLTPTGDGVVVPPHGLAGGAAGAPNEVWIEQDGGREKLDAMSGTLTLLPGARLVHLSAGGGGYGDPAGRDPALDDRDRRRGYTLGDTGSEPT